MAKSIAYSFILFTMSSCWLGNLMVKNLDTIISVKVSNSLELFYKQKMKLDQDIDKFLKQKKHLAPMVKKRIEQYNKQLSNNTITLPKIEAEIVFWQNLYTEIALEVINKHIDYLANLKPGQQKGYFKSYKERNEEIKEELEEDILEKQTEKFERFFGELNPGMVKVLKKNKAFFEARLQAYLARRKDFKTKLENLYKNEAQVDQFKELSIKYIKERFDPEATKVYSKLIFDLVKNLKQEQINELEKNFSKYESWLNVFESTQY
ncbi:MAG: hypothetical protein KC478_02150 [Bacteriovoracaceae bacterium]|nr:hypothetical protein [Bacteriovoracaceae bacterium]